VLALLGLNGLWLSASSEEFADLILKVAASDPSDHRRTLANTAAWFAEKVTPDGARRYRLGVLDLMFCLSTR